MSDETISPRSGGPLRCGGGRLVTGAGPQGQVSTRTPLGIEDRIDIWVILGLSLLFRGLLECSTLIRSRLSGMSRGSARARFAIAVGQAGGLICCRSSISNLFGNIWG